MAIAETARLVASLELKDLFTHNVDNAVKSLNNFDHKLDQTQSRAFRAGQQIGTGIRRGAAAAVAAVGTVAVTGGIVLTKAISAASDLNETVSKVGVVFGAQKEQILAFGRTSAASFGLSQQAADEAAATYGNLFVALGIGPKKAADMSVAITKLAADLASFNNVDPTEALDALRSGLVGEVEPLRKFGVNLSDATLKAEALKLGLIKGSVSTADLKIKHDQLALAMQKSREALAKYGKGSDQAKAAAIGVEKAQAALNKVGAKVPGVLDPATKAQAAYALILEQTKTAQGDFGRTQTGLANQTRILRANFTDLFATLGTPILPAVSKILQRINQEIKDNEPAIGKLGDTIAGFVTDENVSRVFDALKSGFDTIKAAAPFLEATAKATLGFVQAAVTAFTSLPAPIQGLVAGGFALNKLTGGLVTNIAGSLVDLIGKSRGASPANPVFVADVTGGGLPGGAGKGAGGLLGVLGPAGLAAGAIALVGDQLITGFNKDLADHVQEALAGQRPLVDAQKEVAEALRAAQAGHLSPDRVAELKQLQQALEQAAERGAAAGISPAAGADRPDRTPSGGSATRTKDDLVNLEQLAKATNSFLSDGFNRMVRALREARTDKAIRDALKQAKDIVLTQGRGNVQSTERTVAALKAALTRTHDPKLASELRAAIAKVEAKLPGRQFAAQQLQRADRLINDGKVTRTDLKTLQGIERDLKNRGLPHAAEVIRQKIEAAKAAQVAASKLAGETAAAAIKDKDLSVTVNNTVISKATISLRQLQNTLVVSNNYHMKVS